MGSSASGQAHCCFASHSHALVFHAQAAFSSVRIASRVQGVVSRSQLSAPRPSGCRVPWGLTYVHGGSFAMPHARVFRARAQTSWSACTPTSMSHRVCRVFSECVIRVPRGPRVAECPGVRHAGPFDSPCLSGPRTRKLNLCIALPRLSVSCAG